MLSCSFYEADVRTIVSKCLPCIGWRCKSFSLCSRTLNPDVIRTMDSDSTGKDGYCHQYDVVSAKVVSEGILVAVLRAETEPGLSYPCIELPLSTLRPLLLRIEAYFFLRILHPEQ